MSNTDDVLSSIDEALAWEEDWEHNAMRWDGEATKPEVEQRLRGPSELEIFVIFDETVREPEPDPDPFQEVLREAIANYRQPLPLDLPPVVLPQPAPRTGPTELLRPLATRRVRTPHRQ